MTNSPNGALPHDFDEALRLLESAVAACPDALWETDLWPDEAPTAPAPHGGLHGSAPWFLVYHVLTCLDYDLTGGFEQWVPPPPFTENTWGFPNRAFTRSEVLGYIGHCRGSVERTLEALTADAAARPLPADHRHHGMTYGALVGGIPPHVVEHAAQIRAFGVGAGTPDP